MLASKARHRFREVGEGRWRTRFALARHRIADHGKLIGMGNPKVVRPSPDLGHVDRVPGDLAPNGHPGRMVAHRFQQFFAFGQVLGIGSVDPLIVAAFDRIRPSNRDRDRPSRRLALVHGRSRATTTTFCFSYFSWGDTVPG